MSAFRLPRTLAGVLLAAVIPACAPMQTPDDAADTNTQADTRDTISTDTPTQDVVGSDAADTPAIDVPVTDVPVTDVPTTDTPTTDAPDMDATGDVTTDVPSTDVPTSDVPTVTGRCAATTALSLGGMVSGTLSGTSEFASTTCQSNTQGPETVYSLHLDAATGVTFETGGSLDTVISIRTSCGSAASEIACDDDGGAGTLSQLRTVLGAGDYFVIVDEYDTGTGGDFTLTTTSFAVSANAACSGATPFDGSTPVTGDTTMGGPAPGNCLSGSDGSVVYYAVSVPAHTQMSVTATPGGTPAWSPALRVQTNCTSTFCRANATAPADGMPAVVNIDNHGDAAATYILSVGSTSATTGGAFTLSATTSTLAGTPNATCANATPIGPGTMLTSENADLGADTLETACLDYAVGRVLYYRASVPAGSALSVTATANEKWNPVVRVIDACGATSCLASADATNGGAETVEYANTGSAPTSVLIAVGSASIDSTGTFALTASVRTLPYVESSAPTACDDMSAAMVLTDIDGDDTTSPIAPLPFTFSYMGTTASYWSATSNGFMQLWTDTTGTPSNNWVNDPIPTVDDPNGFIAPLWDDLVNGASSDVRVAEFTSGERHFTVQWTAWEFIRDESITANITMQAKLFATSNRIEFHYCSFTPAADGSVIDSDSATIGVENLAGTDGLQHSFNTPGRFDTSHAIVLTPAP